MEKHTNALTHYKSGLPMAKSGFWHIPFFDIPNFVIPCALRVSSFFVPLDAKRRRLILLHPARPSPKRQLFTPADGNHPLR
jgi:hypothetical protein